MVEVRFESGSEMEELGGRADRTKCTFLLLFSLFPLFGGFGEKEPRYGGTSPVGDGMRIYLESPPPLPWQRIIQ